MRYRLVFGYALLAFFSFLSTGFYVEAVEDTAPLCDFDPNQGMRSTLTNAPIYWSIVHYPLQLSFGEHVPLELRRKTLLAAYSWNMIVGSQVFMVGPDSLDYEDNRNIIAITVPHDTDEFGEKTLGLTTSSINIVTGEILHSQVEVREDLEGQAAFDILLHELGHVLGLAHDEDDPFSIMYPVYLGLDGTILTEEDIKYVQATFNVNCYRP